MADVGDIIRVTAVLKTTDQVTVENVFHTRFQSGPVTQDNLVMDDLALWLDTAYDYIKGYMPTGNQFIEVQGFNVTADSPMPPAAWPTQTAGTSGGDITPEGVAALVLFRTAKAHVLGRKFFGTLTETNITNGLLVASAVTALVNTAIVLIAPYTAVASGNTYLMGIFGKGGVLHAITDIVVRDLPAYQRRRRRGRGI